MIPEHILLSYEMKWKWKWNIFLFLGNYNNNDFLKQQTNKRGKCFSLVNLVFEKK